MLVLLRCYRGKLQDLCHCTTRSKISTGCNHYLHSPCITKSDDQTNEWTLKLCCCPFTSKIQQKGLPRCTMLVTVSKLSIARLGCNNNARLQFSTTSNQCVGYKIHKNLRDCYSLLNVKEGCSMEELKAAYFKLAKLYHPDSQSSTADPNKFDQVKEAYYAIKKSMNAESSTGPYVDDDEDDEFDFLRLQPQHRQYLNNQGIGVGTQLERQKQYDQYRVSRAAQNVFDYRLKRLAPDGENALVAKDQKAAKKTKMSNSIDRLVEDMIQESMSRGDFENLSGSGRPLDYSRDNPYTDRITQRLNKMLMDDGLQPDWIMLQKEIRTDLKMCREKLAIQRKLLGNPPYPPDKQRSWDSHVDQFRTNLHDINLKINKFNLIVPILSKQMVHCDFSRAYDRVCQHHEEFLPHDFTETVYTRSTDTSVYTTADGQTSWRQVWADFKGIFQL